MRIVMFYHSLISDWNHGNAHFLRGIVAELLHRGHRVDVYEPIDAWSVQNLVAEHGELPILQFMKRFPHLRSRRYNAQTIDLDDALAAADLVIVHEWNDAEFVRRIGEHRRKNGRYRLLLHDTHHRSISDPASIEAFDLPSFDGVLAFGKIIRDTYISRGWTDRAFTWHEAADTRVFTPQPNAANEGDLVWIGNWGDDERTAELREFLIGRAARRRVMSEHTYARRAELLDKTLENGDE